MVYRHGDDKDVFLQRFKRSAISASGTALCWGIIDGSIQPIQEDRNAMEAERINALSALLNDLTSREAELRRYL
jgi:hypothetical protein